MVFDIFAGRPALTFADRLAYVDAAGSLGWDLALSGADVGAIKRAVELLSDGKCVGIFPQGHRFPSADPRATGTKNGAALIFSRAKSDIVPVYIWRKKNKYTLFGRTYIIIGERIAFDSLGFTEASMAEYNRMTEVVFDKVCELGEGFDPKSAKEKKK